MMAQRNWFALCLAILLGIPAGLAAQQIAGTWKGEQTLHRGTQTINLESTYIFKVDGNNFTGLLINRSDRRDIVDGVIAGNDITFSTRNPFVPDAALQNFKGTLDGDKLTVVVVQTIAPPGYPDAVGRGPRRPPVPVELHRISSDTVYHAPPELQHSPLAPFVTLPPNGLALTPPMGWNSWNKFRALVDDKGVRAAADAMVSSGMKAAGYVYVNIDDTWEGTRDAQGNIQANSKFPDMKALAAYVHSRGLKLGIYSSPGPKTCAGYEGSFGHEEQDARTYAAWGIDYLKYDWCSAGLVYSADEMKPAYEKMALALRATGRPIVFSLCQYGDLDVGSWGFAAGGNLWRTTGDISDNYASMTRIGFGQNGREGAAGPGHWNDPDMLEVGNGGMNDDEYRTHFSLWSLLAAPLLAGNDLSAMKPDIRDILTNRAVIAVDQDKLGRQGTRVAQSGDTEIWLRHLASGNAVGLFNRSEQPQSMSVRWSDIGVARPRHILDLWSNKSVPPADSMTVTVAPHGVVLVRVN
ncbi:MAG TPA: glycoside hydrolase family 27 protein [Terriglobales bacterium]|nr:glycoside hydrolase family 27 protein [Terriglobales bacterium]